MQSIDNVCKECTKSGNDFHIDDYGKYKFKCESCEHLFKAFDEMHKETKGMTDA